MIKKIAVPLFLVMCFAQWIVPGKMIYRQEEILSTGKIYNFITAPVDPSDPFRGKYITLNFEENSINIIDPKEWAGVQHVYVSLKDSAGFAKVSTISMYEPEVVDFVKTEIDYIDDFNNKLYFSYPFDRFYLEESKAAEAEQLYWRNQSDSTAVVYAVVSVKEGNAALKDVMIGERRIADIVREINNKKVNP